MKNQIQGKLTALLKMFIAINDQCYRIQVWALRIDTICG